MTDPTPDPLREALTFLRRRLVGTPPDVDAGDVWMASLLDEAEAIGRAALRSTPAAPQPDAGLREALGTASDTIDRMGWELDRLRQPDAGRQRIARWWVFTNMPSAAPTASTSGS